MNSSSYTLFIRLLYSVRGDIREIQQRSIGKTYTPDELLNARQLESQLVGLSTKMLSLQRTLDYFA